jgi:hypothetical protein
MTCGMVGSAGIGALTKKLGGYTNTKVRLCCVYSIFEHDSVCLSYDRMCVVCACCCNDTNVNATTEIDRAF